MNLLKTIILLLVILITCTAFSQQQQPNNCDSIVSDQALQILNFTKVIKKDKQSKQYLYDDKLDLQLELNRTQKELKHTKNKIIVIIPTCILGGILTGYAIKH